MEINFFIKTFLFQFNNKKYIAAVSGGPDSMWMLKKYSKKIDSVAFVNYKKRDDTWYEEKIIKEFCDKENIKLFIHNVDWKKENNLKNKNFQSHARKIRYDFFCKVSEQTKNNNLIVGHNFNDFLETGYYQIKRKSRSLFYGISQKGTYKNLNIFRPLLYLEKAKIEKKCIKKNVKYNIDYTNDLDYYERNKNRKIILKMSKNEYNSLIKNIFLYNKKNKNKLKKINSLFKEWNDIKYNIDFFISIDDTYKFYIIYLLAINNEFGKINSDKINGIINFLITKSNKKFRVNNNYFIFIKDNSLIF